MDTLSLTKQAKNHSREKTISLTSIAWKIGQPCVNNEIRTLSNTIHKNKMHSRSKHKTETIKLLEENIGRTLSNINHSKIVYDPPPRVMEIKTKVNKWDLIKSFCKAKETRDKNEVLCHTGQNDNHQNSINTIYQRGCGERGTLYTVGVCVLSRSVMSDSL